MASAKHGIWKMYSMRKKGPGPEKFARGYAPSPRLHLLLGTSFTLSNLQYLLEDIPLNPLSYGSLKPPPSVSGMVMYVEPSWKMLVTEKCWDKAGIQSHS